MNFSPHEYATLGFYISGHPLDKYAGRLQEMKAVEISAIEGRRNNEDIVVAGIIVQARPMRSRRGARWAILTLQDRTGVIESLVFPEAFQKLEPILKPATPLLLKGRVAVEDVGTRVIVADARLIEQVVGRPASLLRVRVDLHSLDVSSSRSPSGVVFEPPGQMPRCFRTREDRRYGGDARSLAVGQCRSGDGRARARNLRS